uniref:ZP domain-containing protein n=1 Tax=Enterobius vermicularis TaxID=51028 RepID=A0A0N4VFP5_ENTVE
LILLCTVQAIPIDNGIVGEPEIGCGPTAITVSFNLQNPFQGNVYVKSLFDQPECKVSGNNGKNAIITLPFDGCNTQRTRSLNPKGIFVSTSVVVSFHPQFVTKVDRAYRVQCFYMESEKTVQTNVDVADLTTVFHSSNVPMPVCRYEILDGGPEGGPVHYAVIGQQVYHKWTCDTETINTFCAIVHSCYVNDGNNNRIEILDDNGCAVDKYLLNNLEYPTDLMAGQESHVYKYADRAQLYYQCQISISVKEPNEQCPRPVCAEPKGFGSSKSSGSNNVITASSTDEKTESGAEGSETHSPKVKQTVRARTQRPNLWPSFTVTPESEAETEEPNPPVTETEIVDSGYGRWRRSADHNVIDVGTDLETLDIIQSAMILPDELRSQKPGYSVEVRHEFCITPLQVSLFFAASIPCLIIVAIVACYVFKH